ncbi:MAG TPA: protein kinase [Pirellulaceae bacterium]|nr:protein kinase [Pirellulaceae bacterium]
MLPNADCYTEQELIAYVQGTLADVERKAVETHFADCDACTKTVKAVNKHLLREFGSDGARKEAAEDAAEHGDSLTGPLDRDFAPFDMLEPSQTVDHLGTLNGYDIIRVLGRGGYGIVFEALDNTLHRRVAIKVLTRDLSRMATSRRRFIREARACASINHPNVVTIHGVEDSGEAPYIVMELVRGETLRERIRREPKLDLLDVLRISSEIAQGLAAAHAQGIIHRDVKPGNIMLQDSVRVKIADFGLARVATENLELTSRGVAVGTPAYMSPEQVRGEELDARSDLFAMGCVMYAMFAGHSPFHGRTTLDIAMRIETHRPPRLGELSKGVPEFLDSIVARLLEKHRDKRFQSAAEVADVLSRHLAILNQTPTEKFPVALRMSMFEPLRKAKRWRWPMVSGAFTILAGVAIAGGGFYFRSAEMNPTPRGGGHAPLEQVSESLTSIPVRQRKPEVTVAQTGDADFTTIGEALRNVAAGGTVTIQDDAEYAETILLTDAARYAGIRVVSPKHASIHSELRQPLIKIHAVPNVRLEGLRIVASQEQIGVELSGDCPGTELLDLEIERISNPDGTTTSNAAIAFRHSAAGSAERPIQLRRVVCRGTNVGIVIGNPSADEPPPRHIVVEECHVRGLARDSSTLLALLRNVEDVVIRRNLFSNGVRGISVVADARTMPLRCDISHNSWHELENWFGWTGPIESSLSIQCHHNLVVDSGQFGLAEDFIAAIKGLPPVFTGNMAVVSSAIAGNRFTHLSEVVTDFPLLSREPDHPDYLKPDFASLKEIGFLPGSVPGRYSAEAEK